MISNNTATIALTVVIAVAATAYVWTTRESIDVQREANNLQRTQLELLIKREAAKDAAIEQAKEKQEKEREEAAKALSEAVGAAAEQVTSETGSSLPEQEK